MQKRRCEVNLTGEAFCKSWRQQRIMNTVEWVGILVGQAAVSAVVTIVLYYRLKKKLKPEKIRTDRLERKQDEVKRKIDQRTLKLLALVNETLETSRQIGSGIASLKVASDIQAALRPQDARRVRVVINTLPKVGSSSIGATLRATFPNATIEGGHGISWEAQVALAHDIETVPEGVSKDVLLYNLHRMMAVRPELDRLRADVSPTDGVYFICGTREPLSWALSLLFQHISSGLLPADSGEAENAQRIIMEWFAGRPRLRWIQVPSKWMQREIVDYLKVNPAELGFDHARGYQVVQTMRGRLLLVRQENLGALPEALGDLFGAPASLFKIERKNVGGEKKTGSAYKDAAATLRFPRSFVESVYSDPYATTFYSPQEREEFVARWSL
jgi:hypothetical protein